MNGFKQAQQEYEYDLFNPFEDEENEYDNYERDDYKIFIEDKLCGWD